MNDTHLEKLAMLALAGGCIVALTWIALRALGLNHVDPNVATLIGVIAGGLIAYGKDIIQAIRSYAMSAQLGKVTDQLAASGPVDASKLPGKVPDDAADAADAVAEAATDKADEIKGGSQ